MEHSELSWIHLSDLHIEQEDRFNRKLVFDALWNDIEKFIREGVKPDFIVFTGDIARHGLAAEYDLAIEEFFDPLLRKTSISKNRLFVVPGNHDANWNITLKLRNPIPAIKGTDDIRQLVEDPESRDLILAPFANYRSFAQTYLGAAYIANDPAFYTVHNLEKEGTKVAVLGLNSAWLSGFNRNAEGTVEDFGKLAISEFQAVNAREAFDTAQIVIGLLHHPFDWLIEADRDQVERELIRSCKILLRGHLHRPNVLNESSLSGRVVIIPAGAVYAGRQFPNAYNVVRVNLRTGEGKVFLRRYNKERNEWQRDIESTGEERDGNVTFTLPNFWLNTAYETDEEEPSTRVWAYTCIFTDGCNQDMTKLGLTEQDVLGLVQAEFRGHLNYFLFDLEDYPLPVRSRFIVYLDKVAKRIEFRQIIPCTQNEAKLASWSDILTLYRRATRLSYREQPENILFIKGMLGRTTGLHREMRKRIVKHFENFEGLTVDPDEVSFATNSDKVSSLELNDRGRGISYHLSESEGADGEVKAVLLAMDSGDINHKNALSIIITELERSLQHVHKILLRFPPVDS